MTDETCGGFSRGPGQQPKRQDGKGRDSGPQGPVAHYRIIAKLGAAGGIERRSNPNIRNLHQALAKASIESVYHESPGTAHEWLTWRRSLHEFAPLLFKD
jgi:S-formylglutathione hydrolase FrmB